MARKVNVVLESDLSGKPADKTVRFSYNGQAYELDLTDAEAAKMEDAFKFYVDHARKASEAPKRRGPGAARASTTYDFDPAAVRAWAEANGIEIAARGRVPASIVEQYKAAGN